MYVYKMRLPGELPHLQIVYHTSIQYIFNNIYERLQNQVQTRSLLQKGLTGKTLVIHVFGSAINVNGPKVCLEQAKANDTIGGLDTQTAILITINFNNATNIMTLIDFDSLNEIPAI